MRLILFFTLALFTACIPPSDEEFYEINIDYKDPALRNILDLQVKQDVDSLLFFLNSPNPTQRLFSAKAFGSFKSEEAMDSLLNLLSDPFLKVRAAAAFAIGQFGANSDADAMLASFAQQDSSDVNNEFNGNILEGIGKIGPKSLLEPLSTVSTYRNTDTLLLLGQSRAVYQYGLRKIYHPEAKKLMFDLLSGDFPLSVKKVAANYFSRFDTLDLEDIKFQLLKIMQEHSDPDIRMCMATALTRKGFPDLRNALFTHYAEERDYRVKYNILKQIDKYPYINVVERVLKELGNENPKVAQAAADYLVKNGNGYDAPIYRNFIAGISDPLALIKVHQAILRNSGTNSGSRSISTQALKTLIEDQQTNNYLKGAVYHALAEDARNYQYLIDQYSAGKPEIIKTKTVEALVKMLKSEKFAQYLRGSSTQAKTQIAAFLKSTFESGTSGMKAAAAGVFTDERVDILEEYENTNFLKTGLNNLSKPADLETMNAINGAIAKLGGNNNYVPELSQNVKVIDWTLFDEYSSTPKARIATTKGEIVIELYKNQVPLSVLNFIELSKSGFYNNKYFHRVIANFVAQAGCPNGDGYGALDYTIRSELNPSHYDDEGYVGYASAGMHTESTQWFITQSPTPHLDGKYTIFGRVLSGMETVKQLEIGDKINRIAISN